MSTHVQKQAMKRETLWYKIDTPNTHVKAYAKRFSVNGYSITLVL